MSEGEKVGETTKKTAKEWAERLTNGSKVEPPLYCWGAQIPRRDCDELAALLLAQDALLVRARKALRLLLSCSSVRRHGEDSRDVIIYDSDAEQFRGTLAALREHLEPKEPTE